MMDELEEIRQNLERISEDVKEKIIKKVIDEHPFSDLSGLCSLSAKWRKYILSKHYLFYFDMRKLFVFNFRRSVVWETVSLEFALQSFDPPPDEILKCAASDGGLFCLATTDGRFAVCNPLTRRHRMLPPAPETLFPGLELLPLSRSPNPMNVMRHFLIDMVVSVNRGANTGHFKLVVELLSWDFLLRTGVYDSRRNRWDMVGEPVPDITLYLAWPRAKSRRGDLYFARERAREVTDSTAINVVKYNPDQDEWRSSGDFAHTPQTMIERNGVLLMGSLSSDLNLQFFEVQDHSTDLSQLKLVPSDWSLPLDNVRDAMVLPIPENSTEFELMYIGGEDVVYYVGVLKGSETWKLSVRVLMHDYMDGKEFLSVWEDWTGRDMEQIGPHPQPTLPLCENFHVFKPNLKFYNFID